MWVQAGKQAALPPHYPSSLPSATPPMATATSFTIPHMCPKPCPKSHLFHRSCPAYSCKSAFSASSLRFTC
jgi:hypothetical protein